MPQVAILDDYVGVALDLADWSPVQARAEITVFDRHLSEAEAADALAPFDVLCTLRERMALPRTLIERLPNLKLIIVVGPTPPNLDLAAATNRGVLVAAAPMGAQGLAAIDTSTPELTWGLALAAVRHIGR